MTFDALLQAFAKGIAHAEGFYTPGSRPARNHNPGDMTLDLIGKAVDTDGPFVVFANDEDGFENLIQQVRLMFEGGSRTIYDPSMSILDIAHKYTRTEIDAWAENVANVLGVDVNTTLDDLKTSLVSSIEENPGGSTAVVLLLFGLAWWFFKKG